MAVSGGPVKPVGGGTETERGTRARASLWLAVWALAALLVLWIDDPRRLFAHPYLAANLLMGVAWWRIGASAAQGSLDGWFFRLAVGAGLLARALALLAAPAFSADVFRHIFEGRVMWLEGPAFPFEHAPAHAADAGIPARLLDESWLRINHPEISTLYPPLAQLVFAVAAGAGEMAGSHLAWTKLLLVGADLGTWTVVALGLRARGRPIAESLRWGLCPLAVWEIAREGHADSLSTLGLALGALGFLRRAPAVGFLGWSIAALAKLNGLFVLPAALRTTRRGAAWPLLACVALLVPWAIVGASAGDGLREYAARWRAGDGAFSVLLALAEAMLGGEWRDIAGLTITRHALARGLAGALFLAAAAWVIRRPAPMEQVPARAGLILLIFLLLTPVLHPWYVLWIVPFAALEGPVRAPATALAILAPLLHHPGWLELIHGRWTDVGWVRAIVHIPVWILLCRALVADRSLGYPVLGPCRSTKGR